MVDRRFIGAATTATAMLIAPATALAARPGTVTTCSVSSGVTQAAAKAKGKLTVTITGTSGADSIACIGHTGRCSGRQWAVGVAAPSRSATRGRPPGPG